MCVLLGFALWALLFGPLFLLWWWPERQERHALARREDLERAARRGEVRR